MKKYKIQKKHKMPKKVCPNWDWVKSIEKKALTVIMSFPLNIALLNVRKTQKKNRFIILFTKYYQLAYGLMLKRGPILSRKF